MEIQGGSKHIQKCYAYIEVNITTEFLRRSLYTWFRILKRKKEIKKKKKRGM